MNLETSSDVSQHNFLGCKRVFQADEFAVWFFWKHGNFIFFSAGLPDGKRTSPAYQPGSSVDIMPASSSQLQLSHHLSSLLWQGSFIVKKMHLQRLFSQREWPMSLNSLPRIGGPPSPPPTEMHPKHYFILIFTQKTLSSMSGLSPKGLTRTFKCTPLTRVSKGKICAFTSRYHGYGWA